MTGQYNCGGWLAIEGNSPLLLMGVSPQACAFGDGSFPSKRLEKPEVKALEWRSLTLRGGTESKSKSNSTRLRLREKLCSPSSLPPVPPSEMECESHQAAF